MPKKHVTSGAQRSLLSPTNLGAFVALTLTLAVCGCAVYDYLSSLLPPGLVAGSCAVIVLLMYWGACVSLGRLHGHYDSKSIPVEPRRGLVFMVGLEPEQAFHKCLEAHEPALERCWLICTSRSLEKAVGLRHTALEAGIRCGQPIMVTNHRDPLEIRDAVSHIYDTLPSEQPGWAESDVIADLTGMSTMSALGMALACLKEDRPLQYTPGQYNAEGKKVGLLIPKEIEFSYSVAGLVGAKTE